MPASILDLADGVHRDFSPDQYHAPVLGVASKSALDKVRRSPAHYRAWLNGTDTVETSGALTFGQAFHCALLEPERYALEYAAEPELR
jgi:hypothetical protein